VRFSAKASGLAAAIKTAARIVAKKPTNPILGHARIAAGDGVVTITCTDLSIAITTTIDAEAVEPGATVLPAERLKILLSETATDAMVTIAAGDGNAIVQCDRARFRLPTIPTDGFPSAFTLEGSAAEWTIGTDVLKTVQAAQSNEATRFYLCGVHIAAVDGKLAVVAADGFALVVVDTDIQLAASWADGIIIPAATTEEIIKAGGKGEVLLRSDGRRIQATAGNTTITSRLIDGKFPDYRKIIPRPSENRVTVVTDSLVAALRRAGALADAAREPCVRAEWGATAGDLAITVAASERGESEDVICVDAAGAASVSFSPTKMLTLIEAIGADAVTLDYELPSSAILITVPTSFGVTAALAVVRR
jgi:DNA polymerase-3 subunit beta